MNTITIISFFAYMILILFLVLLFGTMGFYAIKTLFEYIKMRCCNKKYEILENN